jgi:cyanophycin synthetase
MCKIHINGEVARTLSKQKRRLGDVPRPGKQIYLRQNANISTGGIGKDATDEAPAIIAETAIKAAQAIDMNITGVDILYNQLSKKAYVLELNDQPGIDIHHFPAAGQSRNVAKDIVSYLLQEYAAGMQPLSNWQDAPMKPRPEIALKQHN